jgi:hypothetical protein
MIGYPSRSRRKPHPADLAHAAQLRAAVSYQVHLRTSPTTRFDEPAATLDEARTIAARLETEHSRFGRRAIVYAIDPRGVAWPVPDGWNASR